MNDKHLIGHANLVIRKAEVVPVWDWPDRLTALARSLSPEAPTHEKSPAPDR